MAVLLSLVAVGLAIWSLVRISSVETALRERIRDLERTLQGKSTPPAVPVPPAPTPAPRDEPIDLAAARPYEPLPPVAAPPTPAPSPTPSAPDLDLRLRRLWAVLTGGNVFVRIGVLVLFFGVAFLLKYASEHHALPPQARLAGAAATAIALLAAGWRLRRRARGYALVLQGGGMGVLYLTLFASLRLYHLLPADLVFLLLCALVALTGMLALLQDALWLAVTAVLGGFLAPVLVSTGQGSHVVLFSYYLVLNAGILGLAFYRSWRGLNVLGFVCTFVIASAWGALRYQPELFASTEPFLVAFFLLYTAVALLYAWRRAPDLRYYADGTLIFGTPLVGFGLQSAMVHDWKYALAYSAAALALFYFVLAWAVQRLRRDLRILVEAFLALGTGFATLAIPFALDAYWTSAAWALEGAGVAWSGMRQQRRLLLISGVALQWAGGIAFLLHDAPYGTLSPVINTETLGNALIALAGLFSAWYLDRSTRTVSRISAWCAPLSNAMLVWGLLWWLRGGFEECERLTPGQTVAHVQALLLFCGASLTLFSFTSRALRWAAPGLLALAHTPMLLLVLLALAASGAHPSEQWGWLAWGLALPASFLLLWHLEAHPAARPCLPLWHAANLLLVLAAVTWECDWQLHSPQDGIWHLQVTGALPAFTLLALATGARRWLPWPAERFAGAYAGWVAAGIAAYLWCWLAAENVGTDSHGSMLAYVPLLNTLDATEVAVLLGMLLWVDKLRRGGIPFAGLPQPPASGPFVGLAGLAVFGCLNAMLVRTLCYWLPLPFDWDALVDSQVVEMSTSILWTLCALGLMLQAARRGWRAVWFAGATLMALEMAKLFLVDLAAAGSLERIVSFLVVGGLLLLVGYFSPLPPVTAAEG